MVFSWIGVLALHDPKPFLTKVPIGASYSYSYSCSFAKLGTPKLHVLIIYRGSCTDKFLHNFRRKLDTFS